MPWLTGLGKGRRNGVFARRGNQGNGTQAQEEVWRTGIFGDGGLSRKKKASRKRNNRAEESAGGARPGGNLQESGQKVEGGGIYVGRIFLGLF